MGKKAWLFFGNEHAGETAAVFYTLTMTRLQEWEVTIQEIVDECNHEEEDRIRS